MEQRVTRAGEVIVGREPQLTALAGFFETETAATLVLTGEPGAGKTALWEAGTELGRQRGLRVLVARPNDAEARLSFGALADLLEGIEIGELAVPTPQRRALETAILRADPAGTPAEPFAISAGFLSALRALAAQAPLLIAVDDVPWLDQPSAESLAYAARRLHGHAVQFLLARRNVDATNLEQALEPAGIEEVEIGALSVGAARRILLERLGLSLPARVLRQIYETTRGNPLFLLELGRVLVGREVPRIGEEIPVPERVEDLLGTRIEQLTPTVRELLLALALNSDLRVTQLAAITDTATVDQAVDAGLILVEAERARPSHPLLTSAAITKSKPSERRALHLELARVTTDGRLKARHLALATERPDGKLAFRVGAAAADAASRGAAQEAVVLAEHAWRLTPPTSPQRPERLLALAHGLAVAGEKQRVTDLLSAEFESLPPGAARVRGYLLMPGGVIESNDEVRGHLELALSESVADPLLHATVLVEFAINELATRVTRIREAESWARQALAVSRGTGRASPYADALYALAWARCLLGQPIDDLCEEFRTASEGSVSYMVGSPERLAAQRLVWRGEIDRARAVLTSLLALADERGEPVSYGLHRLHLCELELRVGDWAAAESLLDEWAAPSERRLFYWPLYERCRALLAAGRGHPDDAEQWATQAIERASATGVRWDWLEGSRARGIAALFAGDPERAAHDLGAVWEHTCREGVDEPGVFAAAGDLVEALVQLDRQPEATVVSRRLRKLSANQQHPWGLITAARTDALCRLAETGDESAFRDLGDAADAYERLGLHFDRARTLLARGRAERRLRKWGAAHRSLEEAGGAFAEIGSDGWAERARSELSRIGGRKPRARGELTPSEERVVALAAEGRSNKEIASSLFVTVQTVEAHLSHAYAKLGVHSRGQLARRLSTNR